MASVDVEYVGQVALPVVILERDRPVRRNAGVGDRSDLGGRLTVDQATVRPGRRGHRSGVLVEGHELVPERLRSGSWTYPLRSFSSTS